jgi:hypothetical protein
MHFFFISEAYVADLKTMKWGMSDGGYHLKNYVITPVANTNTRAENLFNE